MPAKPDDSSSESAAGPLKRVLHAVLAKDKPTAEKTTSPQPAKTVPGLPRDRAKAADAEQRRRARRYARLGRILLGRDLADEGQDGSGPELVAAANRAKALSTFGEYVATGRPVDEAAVATIRALAAVGQRGTARAFVVGLEQTHGARFTALGLGQVLFTMAEYDRAWEYLMDVPVDDLARLVPLEAVTCALKVRTRDSLAVAREIGRRAATYDVSTVVQLAGRFLVTGDHALAADLVTEARSRDLTDVDDFHREALDNLLRWIEPVAVTTPGGAITVGVIDYHQPDYERASRNVGDYIQTLAMLGNLARFRETRFAGADGLSELMAELQGRVKPELRLGGGSADVNLLPVSRDFSEGDQLPEETWMLAFGWHMHSTFRLGLGLPYHPHVNPIFVSFHINRIGVLTPEVIDYLRAHGPIGCRDWTTVDLLLSADVDAFFTGCLTSTVDAVFPPTSAVEREGPGVVAAIDLPDGMVRRIKGPTEIVTHGGSEHRQAGLVTGVRAADDLLGAYQRRYARVVTSRLHSYLPATSLGLDVRFRPDVAGDVRFDGLGGMKPDNEPFTSMRDGIRSLIADTFELILQGADRDAVYSRWTSMTADRVSAAKNRLRAPTRVQASVFDLAATRRAVASATHRLGPHEAIDGPVTDVAMSLDQNLAEILPVTVESLLDNASGPVRLWVTARGLGPAYRQWFSDQFPQLPVTFLGFDDVDYGDITRLIGHTSIATMDRLLLPEVLAGLDRITYVDIDTVTEGDVCELAATDLQGFALAARSARYSGTQQWRAAGDLLPADLASELRRMMAARHPFDFTAFNAGVLVLDLARMRADGFTAEFVPLMVGRFGLNDQDVLNAYAGGRHAELPSRWNAIPLLERVTAPGIVHFAGSGKPWGAELVPEGHRWHHYARKFADRALPVPAGVA